MKVKRIEGKEERRILTSMITNTIILGRITGCWSNKPNQQLFDNKWMNLIGSWCVKFYGKYGKAPNKAIERLFEKWAKKSKDEETISIVENLLTDLSQSHKNKEVNVQAELDYAEEYFNKVKLKRLQEQIEDSLDNENLEEAIKVQISFTKINLDNPGPIILGTNRESIEAAFISEELECLIRYKGPLKKFWGNNLSRGCFVALMAIDKRGKSFFLLDMAYRAWIQGRSVAFFDTGDMTANQVIRRIGARCAGRPYGKQKYRYPKEIYRDKKSDVAQVRFEECRSKKRLSLKEAWKAIRVAYKSRESKQGSLRIHNSPSGTLSVMDIRAELQSWERESGFVPEVIIIDYADLLAPPVGITEYRHQINEGWKQMRSMSQDLNCLLVTATQANAASYKSELLGRWNFSEDKRKLAHVTGMVGINATLQEEHRQICRLNWIVRREDKFVYSKCVHVASCLAIANPCVRSCW